jgi:hypothetical protein
MRNSVQFFTSISIVATLTLQACNNSTSRDKEQKLPEAFFPVTDYIRSELKEIDSLNLPVTLYRKGAEGNDTTLLSTDECSRLAEGFLNPNLNDPDVAVHFTESSFADQSIPSVNFNYTTKEASMPLKRVDVVTQQSPSGADKVRSIYMEKQHMSGDTLVEEKLFGNADRYYQIIRTRSVPNAKPELSQWKVVWDPTE